MSKWAASLSRLQKLSNVNSFYFALSALVAMLNGGLTGHTLSHSDIGGYTMKTFEHTILYPLEYLRSKELLLRWAELSAFSDVIYRSHMGSDPPKSAQIWDDEETIIHFKNFTNIFIELAPYKRELMNLAEQ